MKRFLTSGFVFPAILLIAALGTYGQAGATAPSSPTSASLTPVGTMQPTQGSIPALTEGEQPIHMPDLIGRSLDYATGIWDNNEQLPQIRVERLSNGPNLVVVRQQPAPGTLIVPAQASIVLTLGQGPVVRPSPTPLPRLNSIAAAPGQATLLRAPYVQNLTTSSVTIVWTSVEDGASEVYYGISDYSLIASATSTFFTTPAAPPYDHYYVHEATLSGLTADTVYQYMIFTNGADLTPGGSATFRTAKPTTTNSFRFAAFGDSGNGSQNQKDVATRLLQVQPDLVLHTGDLIYPEASYDLFETEFFQIYKDLLKSVWIAPVMGNHDVTYNNGQSFIDVFVNPPNATNPAERELYYSFDYGNAHFVMLNHYFEMSTVGSAQYNWLQNDLASSTQFWKFVVFHEPAYFSDPNQLPSGNTKIVQNLVPLFEQYNVDMVLSGHQHLYERLYPLLGGQVSTIEAGAVVYVVTGGGGAGLSSIGTGTLNPRTAAKAQKYHLTMIDVNGCSLQLSAVLKVSGAGDTFDPSDVFDTYTLDRCGVPQLPTATPTATPGPTAADARVQEANPTTNYGTALALRTDAGTGVNVESYLRFTVTGVTGAVQSATLRVFATSGTANGPAVYAASNDWSETGITWNTRPALTSGAVDDKGAISTNTWVEFNVTSLVTGDGTYTFNLVPTSSDGIDFSSREGSNPPQLVVTFAAGPTDTPTPTATNTPTNTPADTPTPTDTSTAGPSPTPTNTHTSTPTFTATNTPTFTSTFTPTVPPSSNTFYSSFVSGGTVGGVSFQDEDILEFNGTTWSLFFDGSDVGLGPVDVFAFHLLDADSLLLSFNTSITLGGVTYAPTDIVRFDATSLGSVTAGTFSMYFNGIDVGLDASSDYIDAVDILPDGTLLISTRGNPSVPGLTGLADEDILAFTPATLGDPTSGTWALYFDGSDVGLADSSNEDVDALDVDINSNGNIYIYLSTLGDFSVTGVAGFDEDVFVCSPTSLGSVTACSYFSVLYFDGSTWGQTSNDLDAFNLPLTGPNPTATSTNTPLPTNTPTNTPTPTNTHTSTPTFTATNTPTVDPSPTPTNTPTATPTATATFTPTNTPLATATATFTATNTPLATATATFTSTPTSVPGSPVTFVADSDAYVSEPGPGTNNGTKIVLWVEGGTDPDAESNLRFSVSGVTGTIQSVTLRVYATSGTVDGPAIYTTSNAWTETGITWNTRPARTSGPADDKGAIAGNTWVEYNVTSFVTGDGIYSFVLATDNVDAVSFSSREGSQPPQLVLIMTP